MFITINPIIRQHLLFWAAYSIYFYLINLMGNSRLSYLTVLYSLPFFVFIFYSVSFSLNRFVPNQKWLVLIFWLTLVYGFSGYLLYELTYGSFAQSLIYGKYLVEGRAFNLMQFLQIYLIMIGHFTFLAILDFQYNSKLRASKERIYEMNLRISEESKRKQFEYFTLSQQVPPHFLVNVFQAWEQQLMKSELPMRNQVGEMYKLMHYFMVSCIPEGPRLISLYSEIDACRRYISIQEEFSRKASYIEWNIKGNTRGALIPPTGLLTLIMNVFKHGQCNNAKEPARLEISVNDLGYQIILVNKVLRSKEKLLSHGLGLGNLCKRLELVFKDQYTFSSEQTKEWFTTKLIVKF